MRKLYLSLLLPLLLLLAQQCAAWHAIEHLGHGRAPFRPAVIGPQDSKAWTAEESSTDKLCETCLAFAQLGWVAKSDAPLLSLLSFSFVRVQWVQTAFMATETPAHRNRGPPSYF